MAFKGYLLDVNGRTLPNKYIQTFKATPDQQQDKDSYQDMTGLLHREVLPHTRSKIDLTTKYLWQAELDDFLSYFVSDRKEISIRYWNNEKKEYSAGRYYAPDIEYQVYRIQENDIEYFPIRVAFIEY